jgi:hypothetical protein
VFALFLASVELGFALPCVVARRDDGLTGDARCKSVFHAQPGLPALKLFDIVGRPHVPVSGV